MLHKHQQWAILNIWQLMQVVRKWDLITIINALSFDLNISSNISNSNKPMFQFYESIPKSLGVFTWVSSFFIRNSSYASSTKELQIESKYIWKWSNWRPYYVHINNSHNILFDLISNVSLSLSIYPHFQLRLSHLASGHGLGILSFEELILMKRKINSIFYSMCYRISCNRKMCSI